MSAIRELNPHPIIGVINPQNRETLRAITRMVATGQTGVLFTWRPPLLAPLTFTKLDGNADLSLVDALDDRVGISLSVAVPGNSSKAIFVKAVAADGTEAAIWHTFVNGNPPLEPVFLSWTNLRGYYVFDDTSTLTDDGGGQISAVANKVAGGPSLVRGSLANVTYVANQQNGRGCVRLTRTGTAGTNGRLESTSSSTTISNMFDEGRSFTIIAVFKPKDTNSGNIWSASHTVSATDYQAWSLVRRSGTSSGISEVASATSAVENIFGPSSGFGQDQARICAVRYTASTRLLSVWDNSSSPVTDEVEFNLPLGTLGTALLFRLGVREINGAVPPMLSNTMCSTDYYALVMAEGLKPSSEIEEAIAYLAEQWGITLS